MMGVLKFSKFSNSGIAVIVPYTIQYVVPPAAENLLGGDGLFWQYCVDFLFIITSHSSFRSVIWCNDVKIELDTSHVIESDLQKTSSILRNGGAKIIDL